MVAYGLGWVNFFPALCVNYSPAMTNPSAAVLAKFFTVRNLMSAMTAIMQVQNTTKFIFKHYFIMSG